MSEFFKRKEQLIIGGMVLPDLDIGFSVPFDDKAEPSFPDITIYNLSQETAAFIKVGMELILNAGYESNVGNILVGTISERYGNIADGVNTVFKLKVTPDVEVLLRKTIEVAYAPGILASQVAADLLRRVDLEVGTIVLTNDICYTDGKIISGTIQAALERIARETNSWYYTRSNIVFINTNVYELDTGFLLRPDTGLIGSPEMIDIDGQTGYKITSLLNPMLTVGSVFRLESRYVNGLFRVQSGTHSSDFVTAMDCLPTDKVSRYVKPVKTGTGAKGNTPKDKIWNFLLSKGFSKAAASGIMGNWEIESGFDPSAENSSSGAYGIAQWLGGRKDDLIAAAAAKGVPVNDLQFQLDYFYWEITDGPESGCFATYTDLSGLDAYKSLTDPEAAAILFEQAFERSGGAAMTDRVNAAVAIYQWDGGGSTASGSSHFSADAFKCACGCGLDCVQELKDKYNQVADIVGDITITSGARCPAQNEKDGGVPDSLHLTGEAVDGYCSGGVDALYQAAQSVGLGTIRYYTDGFVHSQTYPCDSIWN